MKNEDGTSNKRAINPDKPLTDLLIIAKGESIGFNNFQTYIKRLYNSNVPDVVISSDEEIEEEHTIKTKDKKTIHSKSSA